MVLKKVYFFFSSQTYTFTTKNIMFIYLVFRFFAFLFSIMPFSFVYGLSNFICFMLHRVLHYRYKVVVDNITRSFPDMPAAEMKKVIRRFYRDLSDILVESIKGCSMTEKQVRKRFIVKNADILEPYRQRSQSVIAVTSHTGNWEWGILGAPFYTSMLTFGLYKPLSNKRMDNYMKKNRCRNGSHLISIYITAISFERYMKESSLVMMVSDQSPSNPGKAIWVDFLGRDTACPHGAEKYAKIYNLPVFYFTIHRFKRGHYEVEFFHITDSPRSEPEGQITKTYMKKLEEYLRKYPSNWLWSHKRWKHKKVER